MDARHDRYDELAVGHVLGGLDPVDSAEFRSHLVECRVCRLRVAELRDLASELAAAEREERAAARLKTEVLREQDGHDGDGDEAEGSRWRRGLPLVAMISLLVLASGFWAFQLRDQNAQLLAVTERREATLALLAEGDPVHTELRDGVGGPVVADAASFAFTLSGFPEELPPGEVVAIWLEHEGGDAELLELVSGPLAGGRLAMSADHEDARAVLVTIQPLDSLAAPVDPALVRASLTEPLLP